MLFNWTDPDSAGVVCGLRTFIPYPALVSAAPDQAGVYVFVDDAENVVYVGKAGAGRLKKEIQSKAGRKEELGATKFMWFTSGSDDKALRVEADWIAKYQPVNNTQGK